MKVAVISVVSLSVLVLAYMMFIRTKNGKPSGPPTEEERATEARKGAEGTVKTHLHQMRDEIASFGTNKYTQEEIQARFDLRIEEEREYTNRIHKEFGIVMKPDQTVLSNVMTVDIDNIEFNWIACPKDGKIEACFTS